MAPKWTVANGFAALDTVCGLLPAKEFERCVFFAYIYVLPQILIGILAGVVLAVRWVILGLRTPSAESKAISLDSGRHGIRI